jgi:hypothetical protein
MTPGADRYPDQLPATRAVIFKSASRPGGAMSPCQWTSAKLSPLSATRAQQRLGSLHSA